VSTYITRCPRCGIILTTRFCTACGADSEKPRRSVVSSIWSWVRRHPRYAIWIVILVVGGAFAVVDENVDFFEKHSPKLNAAIHSGEITTEGDAEYQGTKWAEDVGKLEANIDGDGWQAVRDALLKRKPYLDDLVDRNDKMQSRLKVEADKHLDQNDICEGLAIHEAGPVMDEYTKLEQEMYWLLAKTATPTKEDLTKMSEIADEAAAVLKKLTEYNDHAKAKGC